MNWSIWPLPKRIASQPTELKRNGRHPRDPQLRNRQGIGWSRTLLPEPRPVTIYQVDGWPGHRSRLNSIGHRHHNPSNNSSKAQGRAFRHPIKETTPIVVSTAAARPISSRIALNLEDLSKGRRPTRTTRARARSRWYKSAREG
jgi:hypothetical protein